MGSSYTIVFSISDYEEPAQREAARTQDLHKVDASQEPVKEWLLEIPLWVTEPLLGDDATRYDRVRQTDTIIRETPCTTLEDWMRFMVCTHAVVLVDWSYTY